MPVPGAPIEFSINPGSGVAASAQQMAAAGVPVNPTLFVLLARLTGDAGRIKAGSYELKPNTTPRRLLDQLVRGEFAQEAVTIIEGWTFRQMRQAISSHTRLKHDTVKLTDAELMAKISTEYKQSGRPVLPRYLSVREGLVRDSRSTAVHTRHAEPPERSLGKAQHRHCHTRRRTKR